MDAVVRTWLGFLALGAGLVHLALVIGSPLPVALTLIFIGAAEFAWGVFAFSRTTPPFPQFARSAVLVPIIGWALALIVQADGVTEGLRVFPMLAASLMDVGVAIGLTVILRRSAIAATQTDAAAAEPVAARPLRAGRYLLAVGAGALIIGAITTPALAATEAGEAASHGAHGGASTPTPGTTPFELHLPDTGHAGH